MMVKRLIGVLCAGILSVGMLSGCTSSSSKESLEIKKQLEVKEQELIEANNEINRMKNDFEKVSVQLEELEKKVSEKSMEEDSLKIVTMDVDYNLVNQGKIESINGDVEKSIQMILEIVGVKYFDGHDLELKSIEVEDGKKIAVVDLTGDDQYWHGRMQGTTGGSITTYTLRENILQKEYKGEWIDGVRFLKGGKPLEGTQHAEELGETSYR